MKTHNSKWSLKAWPSLTLMLLLTVMVVAVGCGKKKSRVEENPYAYGNGYGYGNCANCVAGSSFLLSALGQNISYSGQPRMELGLEFYGAGAQASQYQQDPYYQYQGQIQAQGRLYVYMGDQCNIPAGNYVVKTLQAGQVQGQSIYDLVLEARGPVVLQIQLDNNFVSARNSPQMGMDNKSYPYRLQNMMRVNVLNSAYGSYNCDLMLE